MGPGLTEDSLRAIRVPTLLVASIQNDFLPYEAHAARVAGLIPRATVVELASGEGHLVYLDECHLDIQVMGVPLCTDRPGVDRNAAHARMADAVEAFLAEHLGAPAH